MILILLIIIWQHRRFKPKNSDPLPEISSTFIFKRTFLIEEFNRNSSMKFSDEIYV